MIRNSAPGSAGLVSTKYATIYEPPEALPLDSGEELSPVTLAYETYGELNHDRSNAILVCHALSGDAHAAGISADTGGMSAADVGFGAKSEGQVDRRQLGWWDNMIGPGKAFDTDRYFVVSSNIIGGCKGSTGPSSINPHTGRPYGLGFPVVTIGDMVRSQKRLLERLGVERLLSVSGGSMGGMQALQWAVAYPEAVRSCIPIATTARLSAQGIAFDEVMRQALMADPYWNRGDYYDREQQPTVGLSIARMVGHITYLSDESMRNKFGRRLRDREKYGYHFQTDFEVESYLKHQGNSFIQRFDANSYLYITKAIDYFDLANGHGALANALSGVKARFLIISFSSDWLYPSYQSKEMARALRRLGVDVSDCEIPTSYGHDAFLLEEEAQTQMIAGFLAHNLARVRAENGAVAQ